MENSVDPDQTAPIGAVCTGSTLFASILNSSVMLGNYLQQTTFSDAFFLGPLSFNLGSVQGHFHKKFVVVPNDFIICPLFIWHCHTIL